MLYTNIRFRCRIICTLSSRSFWKESWLGSWKHSLSGTYSTKDACMWLLDPSFPHPQDTLWRRIWHLKHPVNIQFFIWPVFQAAIPTRAVLKGWVWRFQIFASFVRLGLRVFFAVYSSVTGRKQL
jgi:hypothetical protein